MTTYEQYRHIFGKIPFRHVGGHNSKVGDALGEVYHLLRHAHIFQYI